MEQPEIPVININDQATGDQTVEENNDSDTVLSAKSAAIRKSTRINLGVPPHRLGDPTYPSTSMQGKAKSAPNAPGSIKSTQSEIKRKKLQADIEAKKRIAELENETERLRLREMQLNREKELVEMQRQLEHAEIDGEAEGSEEEEKELTPDEKLESIRQWVKGLPSDKSAKSENNQNAELVDVAQAQDPINSIAQTMAVMVETLKNMNTSANNTVQPISRALLTRQSHAKDLPIFSGAAEEWPMFITTYKRSTELCEFSDEENMSRLQKSLKGDALKCVQILLVSPNNSTEVIRTLEKRFGQPRHIVGSLIEKVKSTPSIEEDNFDSIIEFCQSVTNLVQTMKMLRYEKHLNNPHLYEELISKLPCKLQREWAGYSKSDDESIEEFSDWLKKIQDEILFVYTPKKETSLNSKKQRAKGTVLVTSESASGSQDKKSKFCIYCEKNGHQLWYCRIFKSKDITERGKFVKDKRCCFRCLDTRHVSSDCESRRECGVDNCKGKHNPLIHGMVYERRSSNSHPTPEEHVMCISSQINYAVLPVILKGPRGEIETFAMLDTGSAFTLLDESVAKEIGAKGNESSLAFRTLNPDKTSVRSQNVSLEVINPKTKERFSMKNVQTYPNLNLRSGTVKKSQIEKWKHLRGLDLPTYANVKPKILIGLPHADLIAFVRFPQNVPKNAPVTGETKLGWVIMGDMKLPHTSNDQASILHIENDLSDLQNKVKSFFSCEDLGVKLSEKLRLSKVELRAIDLANCTVKRGEKNFEIGLLWSKDDIKLPESKSTALTRLKSLEKKMDRNSEYAQKYIANMQHYIEAGYIKKLTPSEIAKKSPTTWYLPHFGVERENKPGKLRLVFDAAAKSHGVSLNDHLLKGPDILRPLPSVLCKFRERKIALTGDIREMFHQVRMRESDQDSQRLLWRGQDRRNPPDEYKMTVMTFGATCSPFCAQFVKNQNAQDFVDNYPRAVDSIINRHYVDDLLDSCDSPEEAIRLHKEVIRIQSSGGFQVCNWASNCRKVIKAIPEDLRSKSQKQICSSEDSLNSEKVLGLSWQAEEDSFAYTLNFTKVKPEIVKGEKTPTKREALSLIMSIFDPLGFVANLTVKAKIILQKTWKSNIDWDDPLPNTIFKIWLEWISELQGLPDFRVPRCYSPNFSKADNLQLHVFCDASELAYAAVAYVRIQFGNHIEVKLVCAKTRVTPLKSLTVPRCELQAALMGARLARSISEWHEIRPHEKIFWTDSRTVACWLRMDGGQLKTFVAHRVNEIQELSEVEEWRWLPTHENVADEATRDDKKCSWKSTSRWLNGPEFLKLEKNLWPQEVLISQQDVSAESLEIRKHVVGNISKDHSTLIDLDRFSKYQRLLRTTAYVLRFIKILKKVKPETKYLTATELKNAELHLVKSAQMQSFSKELSYFSGGKIIKDSKLSKLSLIMDENGLLCMKGRVQAEVVVGNLVKNPPVLDSRHPFTQLLIKYYHEKAGHHGQDRVTNELKQRFCIPKLRAAVRKSWNDCQLCKNQRALPKAPEMAPLPEGRLASYQRPFTHTGVDYFGPMEVTIGRRREKRYGALFTCLTTRAVHLELAGSLSTDSFIMTLRRFIGRRGAPVVMYSDNGTNFVGAHRELNESIRELNQQRINDELAMKEITWIFNPPSAPHMGGVWERMVRSVKVALTATLKERYPREETLHTLLIEAECTVNGHPLTYVSGDSNSSEVLTPNHFLIGNPTSAQPPGVFNEKDLIPGKQWRLAQRLSDMFWNRWLKEFLPTLTKRQKWNSLQQPLEVGDIVIVIDGTLPRNCWPKGIITEVSNSKDGQTRWAMVKTTSGHYKRPVVKLCVLDVKK